MRSSFGAAAAADEMLVQSVVQLRGVFFDVVVAEDPVDQCGLRSRGESSMNRLSSSTLGMRPSTSRYTRRHHSSSVALSTARPVRFPIATNLGVDERRLRQFTFDGRLLRLSQLPPARGLAIQRVLDQRCTARARTSSGQPLRPATGADQRRSADRARPITRPVPALLPYGG